VTRANNRRHASLALAFAVAGCGTPEDRSRERSLFLPPLVISRVDPVLEQSRLEVLWPLTCFERGRDRRGSRISPFYAYDRRGSRTTWNALLVVDRRVSEFESSLLCWPLYLRELVRGEGERISWLPLFHLHPWLDDDPPAGRSFSFLWPLLGFSHHEGHVAQWILPFYLRLDDAAGRETFALWPLLVARRDRERRTVSPLWPLFSFGSDDAGDFQLTEILWPFHSSRVERDGERREEHTRIVPFFVHDAVSDREGRETSGSILWPLFHHSKSRDGTVVRWMPLLFHYEASGDGAVLRLFHLLPFRF
jgi:hypothetical protein